VTEGVRLRGATRTFRAPGGAKVRAVRGIDLDIASGSTVALLGPNGAGKSTTIDMMLGLSKPDAGTVQIYGGAPSDAVAKGYIGAMLQTGTLVQGLRVRELVALMQSLYPEPMSVDDVLRLCGIADIADRATNKLSGGQTQRVRLACALVGAPKLLVLDEPTAAMDVESRRTFWTAMREIAAGGTTVLFATHYLEEADQYADRVVVMVHGRIVADGSPADIKELTSRRTITASIPDAEPSALAALDGVASAECSGDSVMLDCDDSDAAIRALLASFPTARHIEIVGGGLEDAFMSITAAHADDAA
jgi:ABC-2 type transport system ATP-binding protein